MVWGWDLSAYYDGPFPACFDWKPKLQLDLPTKELVSRKKSGRVAPWPCRKAEGTLKQFYNSELTLPKTALFDTFWVSFFSTQTEGLDTFKI